MSDIMSYRCIKYRFGKSGNICENYLFFCCCNPRVKEYRVLKTTNRFDMSFSMDQLWLFEGLSANQNDAENQRLIIGVVISSMMNVHRKSRRNPTFNFRHLCS